MKTIFSIFVMAVSLNIVAQDADSVFIYRIVDEMTDKTYYSPSRKLICVNESEDIGFSTRFFIKANPDKSLYADDLYFQAAGFGCVEGVEVIFLFLDGTKITLKNWNDFNCDGDVFITLSKTDKQALLTKELSKIRFTNTRSYKSYTAEIPSDNKDYFIQMADAIKKSRIQEYPKE